MSFRDLCYCDDCKHADKCPDAYNINFCEDCKDYYNCDIMTVSCKAGHYIECNNGFEDKNDYCDDEEDPCMDLTTLEVLDLAD